jgi:LasA protease
MNAKRRFPRSTRWLLALLLLASPALACSRETAAVDLTLTVARSRTPTASPLPPAAPTPTATLSPTATDLPTAAFTPTFRPTDTFPPTPTHRPQATPLPKLYITQSGDTLRTVAIRFGVLPQEIRSVDGSAIPAEGLLSPGWQLVIQVSLPEATNNTHLFPDSAIVYSLSSASFDPQEYVQSQGGYMANHSGGTFGTSAELLRQIAFNNSFSPRILLALLEYEGGWITQKNPTQESTLYPLGHRDPTMVGLASQLIWATNVLSIGYYGWRDASLRSLTFNDGETLPLAPDLNAGTVAILYYFSVTTPDRAEWERAVRDFRDLYAGMFGDPFDNAVEPLYYPDMPRPAMELPFALGKTWAFTWGPHGAWERDGARAALDFAPPDVENCEVSGSWVTASAPGLIVRSIANVVVIDLDGDGLEETGWNILYLHIADEGRIEQGAHVETGDPIGHASCQGGMATGTHVHMARKFNGEWMLADGPVPFVLSGWTAYAGEKPGQGTLVRGNDVAVAHPWITSETFVWR